MERPWLSVVIPSHNGERWLGTALESLAAQNDYGIEVIVIDASESDASLRIAQGFSEKLNIKTERRLDLLPWTEKTNYGIEQATGDHICILHQDDVWLPNRSAALRNWLAHRPGAVMHLHPSYIIDEAGRRLGLWRCPLPDGESPVPAHILLERLIVQNFIAIPAPTIRRAAYLQAGGLDNRLWYTADWDLYLKVSALGEVYYHATPFACFRIHRNSLTVSGSKNKSDFREQHEIVVERHAPRLPPRSKTKILQAARASIDVNTALAAVISGEIAQLWKAVIAVLGLGPRGIRRYFLCSRITDRAFPRMRALLAGRF